MKNLNKNFKVNKLRMLSKLKVFKLKLEKLFQEWLLFFLFYISNFQLEISQY